MSSAHLPPHLIQLLLLLLPLNVFQDSLGHHLGEVHPHLQKGGSAQGESTNNCGSSIKRELNHTLMYLICLSSSPIFCFLKKLSRNVFIPQPTAQFILLRKYEHFLMAHVTKTWENTFHYMYTMGRFNSEQWCSICLWWWAVQAFLFCINGQCVLV